MWRPLTWELLLPPENSLAHWTPLLAFFITRWGKLVSLLTFWKNTVIICQHFQHWNTNIRLIVTNSCEADRFHKVEVLEMSARDFVYRYSSIRVCFRLPWGHQNNCAGYGEDSPSLGKDAIEVGRQATQRGSLNVLDIGLPLWRRFFICWTENVVTVDIIIQRGGSSQLARHNPKATTCEKGGTLQANVVICCHLEPF